MVKNIKDYPEEVWYSCLAIHFVAILFVTFYFLVSYFIVYRKIRLSSKYYIKFYNKLKNNNKKKIKIDNNEKEENNFFQNKDLENFTNDQDPNDSNKESTDRINDNDSISYKRKNKSKKVKRINKEAENSFDDAERDKMLAKHSNLNMSSHHNLINETESNLIQFKTKVINKSKNKSSDHDTDSTGSRQMKNKVSIHSTRQKKIKSMVHKDQINEMKSLLKPDLDFNNILLILRKISLDKFEITDINPKKLTLPDLKFIYFSSLKIYFFIIISLIIFLLDIYWQSQYYFNISERFRDTQYILYDNLLINSLLFDVNYVSTNETKILDNNLIDSLLIDTKYNFYNDTNNNPVLLKYFFDQNKNFNINVFFKNTEFPDYLSCTNYTSTELEEVYSLYDFFILSSSQSSLYLNIILSVLGFYMNYLRTFFYIKKSIFFKLKSDNIVLKDEVADKDKEQKKEKSQIKGNNNGDKDNTKFQIFKKKSKNFIKNKPPIINSNNLKREFTDDFNIDTKLQNQNILLTNKINKIINKNESYTISDFFNQFLRENKMFDNKNNRFINFIIFVFSRFLINDFITYSISEPQNNCLNFKTSDFLNSLSILLYNAKMLLSYFFFIMLIGYALIYKKTLTVFLKVLYLISLFPFLFFMAFYKRNNLIPLQQKIFYKLGSNEKICCYNSSKHRYKLYIQIRCFAETKLEIFFSVYTWIFILISFILGSIVCFLNLLMHLIWISRSNILYVLPPFASILGTIMSFILYILTT